MGENYNKLLKKADIKLEKVSKTCPETVINYLLKIKNIKDDFKKRREEINLIFLMKNDSPCDTLKMHNKYVEQEY